MILIDYKLRDFKKSFNEKVNDDDKFDYDKALKSLKIELFEHLKNCGMKDIRKELPDLNFRKIGRLIRMSYTETTNTTMELDFVYGISENTENEILCFTKEFCDECGCTEPKIVISDKTMAPVLAAYYREMKTIFVSNDILKCYTKDELQSILKHEILHHKVFEDGNDPSDTSDDFIKELIKYDAFVSLEKSAQEAYNNYISKMKSKP